MKNNIKRNTIKINIHFTIQKNLKLRLMYLSKYKFNYDSKMS